MVVFVNLFTLQRIETDTSAKKPESVEVSAESVDIALATLERLPLVAPGDLKMDSLSFEKDDDSNGHIDFITAASVSSPYSVYPVYSVPPYLIELESYNVWHRTCGSAENKVDCWTHCTSNCHNNRSSSRICE